MSYCQICGRESKTLDCEFLQNVSYFFGRTQTTFSGNFCRKCMNKVFLKTTTKTFFGTWWGLMGGLWGPYILGHNIKEFIKNNIKFLSTQGKTEENLGILSAQDVATTLGVKESDVINLIETKKLTGKKIGDKYFVTKEELIKYINSK